MHIRQVRKVKRNRLPIRVWQEYQQPSSEAALMQLLRPYNGSHIHGFYQLLWPKMRRRMRLLWTLALLSAFTVLIYISYLLGERYHLKQFHTLIADSHWPIQNIAFPVLIVCNKNRLNWSRLPEVSRRYNISAAQQPLFERVLTAYDALTTTRFDVFETLHDQPLETINHLNFTQIVSELSWRCDEMLRDCSWHTQYRNCCELFRPRRLPQGPCLAFNEEEQRASAETGRSTGLIVRLLLNEERHAPGNRETKGFVVDIVEPGNWYSFPISLMPYTDTDIGLSAVYHFYDEDTFSMSSQQRQCLLDYEHEGHHFQTLKGYKYRMENCLAECQQRHMLRYCNCTLDLFYPPSDHVACQLKDVLCLAAHNHLFQNVGQTGEESYVIQNGTGIICDCVYNCKSLTLITDERQVLSGLWQVDNGSLRITNRSMLLNFYYNQNIILVYRTSLIYSWMDLIGR
ncbi:GH10745 [Drosophila grimshawi]|uniref:GH10745 n=1 Tax=Drosophila grimshawi TaxID=7222 RepID=B4JBP6_DROGR|nr:GH10745 [Drosophila grimshawi]